MVGSGSRSQDLLGDDMIIFLTSVVVAGSNDVSLEFSCGESAFIVSEVLSVKAECIRLILSLK